MYQDPETQMVIIHFNVSFKASIVDREGVRSLLIPSSALFSHLTFQWIRENTLCFIIDVFISPPPSIYWEMSGLAHSLEDTWAMVTLMLNLQLPYPPPSYCLTSAGAQGSQPGKKLSMLSLRTSRTK